MDRAERHPGFDLAPVSWGTMGELAAWLGSPVTVLDRDDVSWPEIHQGEVHGTHEGRRVTLRYDDPAETDIEVHPLWAHGARHDPVVIAQSLMSAHLLNRVHVPTGDRMAALMGESRTWTAVEDAELTVDGETLRGTGLIVDDRRCVVVHAGNGTVVAVCSRRGPEHHGVYRTVAPVA